MSTKEREQEREFIIVGQDQGTSYTLWDAAPAPADATKRACALEEIGVDAMDAFGEVTTVFADTARQAIDKHLAELRERSGLDDYGLSSNSNMDAYGPAGDVAPDSSTYGNAEAVAVASTALHTVTASSAPGVATFNVDGLPARCTPETRDRVRAGVLNGGHPWPESNVLVTVTAAEPTTLATSSLDLAIGCAVLAASGQLPAEALAGVVLVGELGLDGRLRPVRVARDHVRAAVDAGAPAVLVPDADVPDAREVDGIRVLGASTLSEALDLLTNHHHHPAHCTHCNRAQGAHRPCSSWSPCPDCAANGVERVGA